MRGRNHFLAKNAPIFSFKNFPSAALLAAPAVCPHGDGIGTSDTPGINPASYFASPNGKYRSVSDGMYRKGALIERSAFSTSPPNPSVPPTSCFSHVRICRIKLFASAPGIKFVRYSCKTCSNVVPDFAPSRHNSRLHHSCEYSHAVHTTANASNPFVGAAV